MAYGLYDQAADLVNGALEAEPGRQDLLSKLCEIYFVWGNRDAFVDAADRLKGAVGGGESAEWDKIVIMGQQIAGDHELFAGAGTAAATKEMDLSLGADDDGGTGALDMDFGDDSDSEDDNVIDLGAGTPGADAEDEGVDFLFDQVDSGTNDSNVLDMDLEATAESPTLESSMDTEVTREIDTLASTIESPTIEEQFDLGAATSELPSLDDTDTVRSIDSSSTAEIDLDDLGLDVSGLAETELASLDELDATGTNEALSDTGINEALPDTTEVTGKNAEIDLSASGLGEAFDVDDALSATGSMRLAPDETGVNPMVTPVEEATDAGLDDMLAATGKTQVLPEDFAVQTGTGVDVGLGDDEATLLAGLDDDDTAQTAALGDDDATLLAGLDDDDDGDFDFAKTEALPPDAFTGSGSGIDETGELPVASTDVDLDLDDLTAALQVSAGGDTVDMPRDDATVEQPRPDLGDTGSTTMSLGPDDMSDDLDDARTMTEVGTKLDLARAYVDMGDPGGARSILEEVLDEGDEGQRQQAQSLLDSLPA
jgi:pilus assembly protein FimV